MLDYGSHNLDVKRFLLGPHGGPVISCHLLDESAQHTLKGLIMGNANERLQANGSMM